MTRKRVGAWVWWVGAAGALLLAGAVWFYASFALYSPLSANFDPLIQALLREKGSSWARQAEMRSCCFPKGKDQASVLKRIKASGFVPIEGSGWDEKFFGREYLDSGVAIYRTYASRFPCSDEFFIAVKFDEQERLEKAEGTWINAACL